MALPIDQRLFRFCFRHFMSLFYRVRVFGYENVPREGGALLVPNHISWLDGFLVKMVVRRHVRAIVHAGNFQGRMIRAWADRWQTIYLTGGPKAIVRALKQAQQAVLQGDLVMIFPEGGITRNGQVQAFRPGLIRIIEGTGIPVVPVYLDELWGSFFSFSGGHFFRKWPRKWRYPVSIHFGKPMTEIRDAEHVRQAVQLLGVQAMQLRDQPFPSLTRAAIKMCKRRKFSTKVADSTAGETTGGQLLLRALIVRRLLRRHVLSADEKYVGVLLPPSAGGVVINLALALDRRVPVNLNYTASSEILNQCIAAAGIRHVLTSRQVLSKLDLKLNAKLVPLEDFKPQITLADKLAGVTAAYAFPTWLLSWTLGLQRIGLQDEATVIFTSGSTGIPKGVVLTYANIASNVVAIEQVIHLRQTDVMLGILPFFHSFGFTVTLWTPLGVDMQAVYHYSPLDAKRIGQLVQKYAATVLLATPTFLRGFVQRCTKEQFQSLNVVVTGAEKLPISLAEAFEEKFGVRPVEGYGCTELSPLVSVNVPPSRSYNNFQRDRKQGSVGRAVPGVAAKVVDLQTGNDLPTGQSGMLLVTGANVMKGYLNEPEKTQEVVRDGWYVTGDVAFIDEEGFIHITGRESRFSKIGGEMVPHIQVEEILAGLIGISDDEAIKVAVTSVTDEKKGERLIVLHTKIDQTVDDLRAGLSAAGLPNLYIPSTDSFLEVESIPVLGTGKLDLKAVQQLAQELLQSRAVARPAAE